MPQHPSILLTPKDSTLLETILEEQAEPFSGAASLIRGKLAAATLVEPRQMPPDAVTLNSRVRFRSLGGRLEERVLVAGPSEGPYGTTLLLRTPRGIALLGARAGQTVEASRPDGSVEHIAIEAVPYQPEQRAGHPGLTLVGGASPARATFGAERSGGWPDGADTGDDPGPSAA